MANDEQLKLLKTSVDQRNSWRREHPEERVDLASAELTDADLDGARLDGANLVRAELKAKEGIDRR